MRPREIMELASLPFVERAENVELLRVEDPVHWTKGRLRPGVWSITRLKDCRAVFPRCDRVQFAAPRSRASKTPEMEAY
jgi:hypothetical protein